MSSVAVETPHARIEMKLEIVVIPVSDVDRAKSFYSGLGWRLDADFGSPAGDFRVIQFTPPGSGCSVIFGKNVTAAAPGSAQGLYLVVSDIDCRARRAHRRWRRGQRGVPRRRRRARWNGRTLPFGTPPCQRCGSRENQLSLVRLVQGSRRQRLAVAGDHRATAGARLDNDVRLDGRPRGCPASGGGRPRRAREAERWPTRRELAGVVRGIHAQRAGGQRAALVSWRF